MAASRSRPRLAVHDAIGIPDILYKTGQHGVSSSRIFLSPTIYLCRSPGLSIALAFPDACPARKSLQVCDFASTAPMTSANDCNHLDWIARARSSSRTQSGCWQWERGSNWKGEERARTTHPRCASREDLARVDSGPRELLGRVQHRRARVVYCIHVVAIFGLPN